MRKSFLVFPKFQFTLLGLCIAVNVAVGIAFLALIYRGFENLKVLGTNAALPANHKYFNFVEFQQSVFINQTLVLVAVSILVTALVTLFFSHRFAGPLRRLRNHLRTIKDQRRFTPLSFRKDDYLAELADEFNEAYQAVQGSADPSKRGA